ncbi:MAG: hypothetical protein Q4F60_01415 [Candidatus Saccharibacteria bacterium]|nr:hypothetical protein [Candidatus Saccharibacteria bacterium]
MSNDFAEISPKNPRSRNFAEIPKDLAYWTKQEKPLFNDYKWNIPEQKSGYVSILGGNSSSFSATIKIAEELLSSFPIKTAEIILPDALRNNLPPLENTTFLPSTTSGSFGKSPLITQTLEKSNFIFLTGELTKNSETTVALADSLKRIDLPILLARDSLDTLLPEMSSLINHPQLFIFASLAQIQKLLRTLYYPKVLMLSMPLLSVIDTLHKFTLSYPTTLITFHSDEIIIANSGKIITTNISLTNYSPLSLWFGSLATKITALNLYNPKKPLEATAAALF